MTEENYYQKYLKYKRKYISLQHIIANHIMKCDNCYNSLPMNTKCKYTNENQQERVTTCVNHMIHENILNNKATGHTELDRKLNLNPLTNNDVLINGWLHHLEHHKDGSPHSH